MLVSHYRVEGEIGRGGMGVVYRAVDTTPRPPRRHQGAADRDATGDPERHRRFLQEARPASALNHPNIVTIYEVGEDEGTTFIAMELVDGTPLDTLLAKGPLPRRRRARLRGADRRGARGRARGRHHPSRHQARQHHDHRATAA